MIQKNLETQIEIDGGINFENAKMANRSWCDILVSGTTIFKENGGNLKKNIQLLRIKIKMYSIKSIKLYFFSIIKLFFLSLRNFYFTSNFYNKKLITFIPDRIFYNPKHIFKCIS